MRMLSPLGRDRMLGSIERFCRRSGMDGVFGLGANGGGLLPPSSPVPGRLPLRNCSSGPPGRLGPWKSPGFLLKFGFWPGGPGGGIRLPSSGGILGDSPGLRGGGPGDFGGMGRWSGVVCRACRGSRSSMPPALGGGARPSPVARCGWPLVRPFNSLGLKPVKVG